MNGVHPSFNFALKLALFLTIDLLSRHIGHETYSERTGLVLLWSIRRGKVTKP
jgi:hypothetical protein